MTMMNHEDLGVKAEGDGGGGHALVIGGRAHGGTAYAVEPIDPGPEGTRAYRLQKLCGGGDVYDVVRTWYGIIECTCGDYTYRRQGLTASPCKHGRALVEAGLLAPPEPCTPPAHAAPSVRGSGGRADGRAHDHSDAAAPADDWDGYGEYCDELSRRALEEWEEGRGAWADAGPMGCDGAPSEDDARWWAENAEMPGAGSEVGR
jgi:hypothetical protein